MSHPIILLGSGLAGYNVAREIRARNAMTPILLITQNAGDVYSKPMLSTALALHKTPEMLIQMSVEKMAAQHNLEILVHTCAEKIITQENKIILRSPSGAIFEKIYSQLVLCIGAETVTPRLLGEAAIDILQVNDLYQYQIFRKKIVGKNNITLLGAGLVGCEFAHDLTVAGYKVNIIEPAATPIATLLPQRIGYALQLALEQQGVHWYLGHTATTMERAPGGYRITLENQQQFTTEVVFSAIGLRPRLALARAAGIHTQRGIIVNNFLCTNIQNIYALGDCAEINGALLPYIAPLLQASKALAQTLTQQPTPLTLPPMPISIKTNSYPIVVCRPPQAVDGDWFVEEHEGMLRAYLKDSQGRLQGFILTQEAIKERAALVKLLNNWL